MVTENGKADPQQARDKDLTALNALVRNVNALTRRLASNQQSAESLLFSRQPHAGRDVIDQMCDPRRDYAADCGYPTYPTIHLYSELYNRHGPATRVVDVYPEECWAIDPAVTDSGGPADSPFEAAVKDLDERVRLFWHLFRLDVLQGVGRFAILFFGFDDGNAADPSKPVMGLDPRAGGPRTNKKGTKLLYCQVFDETLARVAEVDQDRASPRCGLPVLYEVNPVGVSPGQGVFPLGVPGAEAASSGPASFQVHWTRVLHGCDPGRSSLVYGPPRQENVLWPLLDLRKVLGGSAEMYWQGALPGLSFEELPEAAGEMSDDDVASLKEQIYAYVNRMQRYLALQGMTAKSLSPQVVSPTDHVMQQVGIVCAVKRVPVRIFMGSGASHQAGVQDTQDWNRRLAGRQTKQLTRTHVRPCVQRLVDVGALPPPAAGKFQVTWNDLNAVADKDRADIGMKKAMALVQYVTGGVETVMTPLDFLVEVFNLPADRARAILDASDKVKQKVTEAMWKKPAATPGPGESPGGLAGKDMQRNGLGQA